MRQIEIKENEAGQRLDKFLHKYLPLAPSSFLYKMLRKKNITLNGKKAEGGEKLNQGDSVSLFFSEETISGFQRGEISIVEYQNAYETLKGITPVYEDSGILILNKPVNVLSQKAKDTDLSANEWLIGYLLMTGQITREELATFKPSICNRLDRNTRGLLIGSKSLAAGQAVNELIRCRQVRKFYQLFVKGQIHKEELLEGYLVKDEERNRVRLVKEPCENASPIQTRYYPLANFSDRTLVEAELITGKPHQIRAHMAGIGHPILGDYKYGDRSWNEKYKAEYGIKNQLLYACRLEFGNLEGVLSSLSGQTVTAPIPDEFKALGRQM
ncbi:MAG: RluA family pseudouridine synthase [Lachnospiraceae bacterium]|nr:RluA family pseudouridine synthase [Lachnospiraceae bacterium]